MAMHPTQSWAITQFETLSAKIEQAFYEHTGHECQILELVEDAVSREIALRVMINGEKREIRRVTEIFEDMISLGASQVVFWMQHALGDVLLAAQQEQRSFERAEAYGDW